MLRAPSRCSRCVRASTSSRTPLTRGADRQHQTATSERAGSGCLYTLARSLVAQGRTDAPPSPLNPPSPPTYHHPVLLTPFNTPHPPPPANPLPNMLTPAGTWGWASEAWGRFACPISCRSAASRNACAHALSVYGLVQQVHKQTDRQTRAKRNDSLSCGSCCSLQQRRFALARASHRAAWRAPWTGANRILKDPANCCCREDVREGEELLDERHATQQRVSVQLEHQQR